MSSTEPLKPEAPAPQVAAESAAADSTATASPPGAPAASPAARPLSRPRKWLFRLAAMALGPLLFLAALELGLRLAGYGESTDFFLDRSANDLKAVWTENPD